MADLPPGLLPILANMLMGGKDSPIGGNKFGGAMFGGNRFGGNTFGGNKFGASAPQSVTVPATPPALPAFEEPGSSLPMDRYMTPPGAVADTQPAPAAGTAGPPVTQPVPIPPVDLASDPNSVVRPGEAATEPEMPPPIAVGNGSVRADLDATIQKMIAEKKLPPEMWKGSYNNWQFPT